jgi:hypothetical protein
MHVPMNLLGVRLNVKETSFTDDTVRREVMLFAKAQKYIFTPTLHLQASQKNGNRAAVLIPCVEAVGDGTIFVTDRLDEQIPLRDMELLC